MAMTSGDLKGDTAKGARILSERQARERDKARKGKGKVIPMPVPDRRRREDREVATPDPTPVPAKKVAADLTITEAETLLGITPPWNRYPELKDLDFGRLCEQRQILHDEIAFRETRKKALDEQIEAALAVAGVEKVVWEDRPVQIVHKSGSAKLVPEKLLEHGVPADTIAACTTVGAGYSYLLIGKPKKET
jgi:hypothetical protein